MWRFFAFQTVIALSVAGLQAQTPELKDPGHNLDANNIHKVWHQYPWLRGEGRVCSVKEYPFDTSDIDLKNRCLWPLSGSLFDIDEHATVMASLIGGNGVSEKGAQGVAPACTLSSSDYNNLLPDPAAEYHQRGVSVQNHSYGNDISNFYSSNARAYDQSTLQNPVLLHVFSAGNTGTAISPGGPYEGLAGWSNLTGHYKMGKNMLLVGATDSVGQIWPYSSRGPAFDGRVKPDLAAFSQNGSSGAAALVSGTALLVQEALDMSAPPAALVRAILINSATNTGEPGPDFSGGFGNLNAYEAVTTAYEQRFRLDSLLPGASFNHTITVPPNAARLRITLAWNDPPAAENAATTLLHDLDLSAIGPDGQTWLPWVLHTHRDSLGLPAYRGRDQLNTLEQTSIPLPAPGAWNIRIARNAAGSGYQSFAISWSIDTLNHFAWNYPVGSDALVAGTNSIIRWESTSGAGSGRLEYKPVDAAGWTLVDTAADRGRGWYRWLVPDTFAEVQLRLTAGGASFSSDTFLISPELRLHVDLNCPDSLLLRWNQAGPDARYELSGLGARYLEPLAILFDTFVVLPKTPFPQQRFAVTPLGPGGRKGWRSPAPDIDTQAAGCYIDALYAEATPERQTDLGIRLGTAYDLEKVVLERLDPHQSVQIAAWQAPFEALELTAVDESPQQGLNYYRARVTLTQNRSLLSDTAVVAFAASNGFLVFPNPASPGTEVQILAENTSENARFYLSDWTGRSILEQALNDFPLRVPLPALPRGVYTAWVWENGKIVGREKLVVGQ